MTIVNANRNFIPFQVMPIADEQARAIDYVNRTAGTHIERYFPAYKQRNYLSRQIELLALNQTHTAEWDEIAAVWAWAKEVRTKTNAINAAIEAAIDKAGIDVHLTDFAGFLPTSKPIATLKPNKPVTAGPPI